MLIADMKRTGPVQTVIRSAGRRRTYILALEELGLALGIVLAGVILMLVLGTHILRWYWLLFFGVAAVGIAGYRVHVRRLSLYCVAQLLDRRLRLSDSLSTAWFLLTEGRPRQDAAARFQILRAERIAANVKLPGVFRFRGQRSWALASGLAAVAFGLFAVRYLVTDSLNLEQSMIPLPMGEVLEQIERAAVPLHLRKPDLKAARRQGATPAQATLPNEQQRELFSQQNLKSDGTNAMGRPSSTGPAEARNTATRDQPQAGQTEGSDKSSSAQSRLESEQSEAKNAGSQQESGRRDEAGSNDQNSSGLVDKMKDALSSLMAKLRPNTNGQNSSEGNQRQSQDQRSGDQTSAAKDANGNMQQSARDQQANHEKNAPGAAQGQTTEKTQASQGQSSDESAEKKSAGAHSGIGHTNGDKDIRSAEQLKAMGKLAEIIGKRSANLTGDMTVETSSSNQQLKTQYSGRVGRHADLGGEINRDEIPIAYRDYIREYMQLVHKQAEREQ